MINITIIGMGLIGTSLGMALRNADPKESPLGQIHVSGYDNDSRSTSEARGRLAIDREARSLEEALRDAHLVVVAVPVQVVREVFMSIAPLLPEGCAVTDVSSVKQQVMDWAAELLPAHVSFIGGHPMAGREQSGPKAATGDLFKQAIYCLTPSNRAHESAVELVDAMVRQVGAKTYFIDANEHDIYVAGISHLPFLLSAALIDTTVNSPSWTEMAVLASSGFRDVSRLASGDPQMHNDICMTNRAAIVRWLNQAAQSLIDMRDMIEDGEDEALFEKFKQWQTARDEWVDSRPNMRPGEADYENLGGTSTIERPSLFGRLGGKGREAGPSNRR
jgi:prephenate dehydrogenase